jgi:hypothetical protein
MKVFRTSFKEEFFHIAVKAKHYNQIYDAACNTCIWANRDALKEEEKDTLICPICNNLANRMRAVVADLEPKRNWDL